MKNFTTGIGFLLLCDLILFPSAVCLSADGSLATRSFSSSHYGPGQTITVKLVVTPVSTVFCYGVEERAPVGWELATGVRAASVFPGVIKFPINYDNAPREYTYTAKAPAGAAGFQTFSGVASFDGKSISLGGDSLLNSSDSPPPVISGVNATGISATAATIRWTTNQASDSQVEYGLTSGYGSASPLDAAMVTAHSVTLTGLASGSVYHYRVKSKNAQDTVSVSGNFTLNLMTVPPPQPLENNLYRMSKNLFHPMKQEFIVITEVSPITSVIVYTSKGAEIKPLEKQGGAFSWDGRNRSGEILSSGTYLLVIRGESGRHTERVVLAK